MTTPHRQDDGLRTSLSEIVEAIETKAIKIDSPNIGGGDPEIGYEPHYWIDEWLHHAKNALATPASRDGAEGTAQSPLMKAAEKAQKTVDGWTNAKRDYAERVTGPATPPKPAPDALRKALEPFAFIDARLEDLAEANALYGKDKRLDAEGKIARNNREISWLRDLKSILSAPVPPADGVGEATRQLDRLIAYVLHHYAGATTGHDRTKFERDLSSIGKGLRAEIAALAPLPAGAAEAVGYVGKIDLEALKNPNGVGRIVAQAQYDAVIPLYASPPLREEREAIARIIFKNRQHLSDADVDKWFKIYSANPEGIDHFRMAIWRAYSDADAILSLQSGAGEGERWKSLRSNIERKIAQLTHYRDHDCQLDHSRTIADGRIMQATQDLLFIDQAMSSPAALSPTSSASTDDQDA